MITWFQVWPLLTMPYILLSGIGLFPFIREGMLNLFLLPLLPFDIADRLVTWYNHATLTQEMLLHVFLAFNLATITYPIFYAIGVLYIKIINNIAKSQIQTLNKT